MSQDLQGPRRLRRPRPPEARRLPASVPGVGARSAHVLVAHRPAHRLDPAVLEGEGHQLRREGLPHPLVLRRQAQRRGELSRPPPDQARRQDCDPVGRRRSAAVGASHVSPAVRARVPVRECAQGARRAQGRSRHDLHADDSRDRGGDARVRAHRRGAFGRVRRLLARVARGSHRRLRLHRRDHRRRRSARRQAHSAQGERRCGARSAGQRVREARARRAPPRLAGADAGRPRSLVRRRARRPAEGMPAGGHGRGRSAVHSLHLGLHRQTQGRAAHDAAAISSSRR